MLIVKKSKLPNAGMGLFTTKSIKKGTLIVEYEGEHLTWAECEKRNKNKPQLEQGVYYFFITKKNCVDAEHTKWALARYANDARGFTQVAGLTNNSEYEIHDNRAFIVAKRNIEKGEEIFVDYGTDYWKVLKPAYKKKLKEKEAALKKKEERKKSVSSRAKKKH